MTKIGKIMRRDIVGVGANDTIATAWRSMVDQGLSGVPVLGANGGVIGIVTEADLMARLVPRRTPRWWELVFADREALARDYRKAIGTTVADVMTSPPLVIEPDPSVSVPAALMNGPHIAPLPRVEARRLVGVVTRTALTNEVAWESDTSEAGFAADDQLVREMHEHIENEPWLSGRAVHARAHQGVLELQGLVDSEAERAALRAMACAIPGCIGVEDHLLVRREALRRSWRLAQDGGYTTGRGRSAQS